MPRKNPVVLLAALAACAVSAGLPGTPWAQEPWTWPEKAANLQVLPPDSPPERLRAVMTGFTRALGVGCSHCHVGKPGQPLSTYDFATDTNPAKGTARAMLTMLGTINDQLKEIQPSGAKRVNMWCHTCHNGRARPMTLEEELTEVLDTDGLEAAVARYRDLRERFHGRAAYDFTERSLNQLGYNLLGAGKNQEAIAFFKLNAENFPASGNVHDSLAEAYMTAGQRELAIIYYQKALGIDPDNKNALENLRKLQAGP